jgi:ABC-type molybdate transport system ATPase subunit
MNKIEAVVTEIKKTDVVTYVYVKSADVDLRLICYKAPVWLASGDSVYCTFQEAAVCVSKECPGRVSIENKLPVVLKEMRQSESLCELTFDTQMGKVVSLITQEAYDDLGLELECDATMLVRGVDIKIEPFFIQTRTKDAN